LLKKLLNKIITKLKKKYRKLEKFFLPKIFALCYGHNLQQFPSSIHSYYNFKTKNQFLKVATRNKKFLEEEKSNISHIKTAFPEVAKIIPQYDYKKIFFGSIEVRSSEIMVPTQGEDEYKAASLFLNLFRKYAKESAFNLDSMIRVKEGIAIIEKLFGAEKAKKLAEEIAGFLQQNLFFVGPCHGDFHSKNFLKTGDKNYLIDFDCFRNSSLQELDAIYFIIQKIIDDNPGIWWHEAISTFHKKISQNQKYRDFLENFIDMKKIENLVLIYFLDRISQDAKYLDKNQKLPEKEIISSMNLLKKL
jgi:thiamine kinase-like enzyme